MPASILAVATAEGNRLSPPLTLPAGSGTRYIYSSPGQRIVLSDAHQTGQPSRMAVNRHGKNLILTVPGDDEPRLVIYDFYDNNACIQGIGGDGRAHDWVSVDNGVDAGEMDDGDAAFMMLSDDASNAGPLFVPEHNTGAWMAMAAFAGLLGLGGIVRSMQNQHSGPGESPPPAPVIAHASDVTGIYTGTLAHGGVTDDAAPELTGSGSAPGALITVYADGSVIGSTLVAEDGTWSLRPPVPLAHGLHTFTATATAASGLVSGQSAGFSLDVDLIAPARPQVMSVDDDSGTLTGALASGGVTDDALSLFTGQAEPGALIVFMLDGVVAGSAIVAAGGDWQWQPASALPDGPHSFTAQATDLAGNTGLPSVPFTFIVDTVIATPLLATATDAVSGGVEGSISNDGTGLTNDPRPALAGIAEPGSLVTLYDGADAIGSVYADAAGAWAWQFSGSDAFADGVHALTVRAADAAGNVSAHSDAFIITVDTQTPQPLITTVTDTVGGGVEGSISNDGTGLTNDARPALAGRAEPGSLVTIYDGTAAIGSVRVDAQGAWRWQHDAASAFAEGAHALTVQATDPAGNTSAPSETFTITVDTLIAQPVLSAVADAVAGGVVGDISNDGTGLTNDARPALAGIAEPGSLVTVYDGTVPVGSVYADAASGAWRWQLTGGAAFAEGAHTLTVQATDAAGNTSAPSDPFIITVDSAIARPVLATVTDAVAGGVVGDIARDGTGLTNDARPLLSGSAEPGSLVTIYDGLQAVGSVYADAAGAWRWQYAGADTFAEGVHTLTVQARDLAGNISAFSDSFVITVDTVIVTPALTTITDAVSGGAFGAIANDGVGLTNDARPLLSGSAERGSLVTVYDGAIPVGSVYADATTGNWTWQYTGAEKFTDDTHVLTVTALDLAGNLSGSSTPFTITVDTLAPDQTITEFTDEQNHIISADITNKNPVTLSGWIEPDEFIYLWEGNNLIGPYSPQSDGSWSIEINFEEERIYHFQTEVRDLAGNSSGKSPIIPMEYDITPPPPLKDINWDGETLLLTFESSKYSVGDVLTLTVDGVERIITLSQDDLVNNAIRVPWSSSIVGNSGLFEVLISDRAGNISSPSELRRLPGQRVTEDFNTQNKHSFAAGESVAMDNFTLNILTSPVSFDKGQTNWTYPSSTMALTIGGGGSVELDVHGQNYDFIEFTAGDFTTSEVFTITFYDINDNEVASYQRTPSGGLEQQVLCTLPYGQTFSKVTLTLNTSGVWIDNITVGSTHYETNIPQPDVSSSSYTVNEINLAFTVEQLNSLINHDYEGVINPPQNEHEIHISADAVLILGQEDLFHESSMRQLMVNGDQSDVVVLEKLLGTEDDVSNWNNQGQITIGGIAYDVWQNSNQQVELLVQQGMQIRDT